MFRICILIPKRQEIITLECSLSIVSSKFKGQRGNKPQNYTTLFTQQIFKILYVQTADDCLAIYGLEIKHCFWHNTQIVVPQKHSGKTIQDPN